MPKRNEDMRARIEAVAREHTLSEVARRCGTSVANVSRYVAGTRVPAEFCSALIRSFNLNPAWLMTGEGSPSLADITAGTVSMAGNVLELVEAMNAVTRMRLGALTGKHHLRVLRELNEALLRYEELRASLNRHSAPIFRKLLDDLAAALNDMQVERAEEIRKAAAQVERLCDEPELSLRFTRLQAHVESLSLNAERGLYYQQKVLRDLVTRGHIADESDCEPFLRLALMLSDMGRVRDALGVTSAFSALAGPRARGWGHYHEIQFLRGMLMGECGRLQTGLKLMQRHIGGARGRRYKAGRCMLLRAQLYAGLLTFEEALHVAPDIEPKGIFLLDTACWMQDGARLEAAIAHFDEHIQVLPGIEHAPALARATLLSLQGGDGCKQYLAGVKGRGAEVQVNAGTLAGIQGDSRSARRYAASALEAYGDREQQARILSRARLHRLVLRTRVDAAAARHARRFFARLRKQGYALTA